VSYFGCCSSCRQYKYYCNCHHQFNNRESAFRAVKTVDQAYTNNTIAVVNFNFEQFDLNNEYDGISTFIPKEDGLYYIVANLLFTPEATFAITAMEIQVNNIGIAGDLKNDVLPILGTSLQASTIYPLRRGDLVNVRLASSANGVILGATDDFVPHFAAVKLPLCSRFPQSMLPVNGVAINQANFIQQIQNRRAEIDNMIQNLNSLNSSGS